MTGTKPGEASVGGRTVSNSATVGGTKRTLKKRAVLSEGFRVHGSLCAEGRHSLRGGKQGSHIHLSHRNLLISPKVQKVGRSATDGRKMRADGRFNVSRS